MFPRRHTALPEHLPCQISKKTRRKQKKHDHSSRLLKICVPFIETHIWITPEYLHTSPVVAVVPLFFPLSLCLLWPCCARSRLSCFLFFFVSAAAFCVCRISYQKPFDSPTLTGERNPSDTGNEVSLPSEHPRSIIEFSFFSSDEATLFHSPAFIGRVCKCLLACFPFHSTCKLLTWSGHCI